MGRSAKDKADSSKGVQANPDEVLTTGENVQAPSVGIDATSVSNQDLAIGSARSNLEAKGSEGTFLPGTVIAVITDPDDAFVVFDQDAKIKGKIKNYADLKKSPRGSLLIKMLEEKVDDSYEIVFPFFQSHFMLPVSIGETVWVMQAGVQKFWFSRVAGSALSEDVCHTHIDRDLITPAEKKDTAKDKDDQQKGKKKNIVGTFLSGLGKLVKRENTPQEDAKPEEVLNLPVYKPSQHESVPRFKPRPGDLVLQGSHNTLISFSTDRGWSKNDSEFKQSNANHKWEPGKGTIDIVVGRGTQPTGDKAPKPTTVDEKGTDPSRTAPRIMKNQLGTIETDKISNLNGMPQNPAEGDPDFHTDLSRIYISMSSPIDQKLTLGEQSPKLAGTIPLEDKQGPAIALKSNEIRFVAREEGSIRIVKEGNPEAAEGSGNRACVVIQPDGSIHLIGEKIFIGKSSAEGGHKEVTPQYESDDKMNPYVLFSVLQQYLTEVHDHIDAFCNTVLTHQTPGYGAPSPQINNAAKQLKSKMEKTRDHIEKLASKRIFGE